MKQSFYSICVLFLTPLTCIVANSQELPNVKTWSYVANTNYSILGLASEDRFGIGIADMGDLDGNGTSDLIVGCYMDDDVATNAGAAFLLYMNSSGGIDSLHKITEGTYGFTGNLDASDQFGRSVANIGDLDNNGSDDIAVTSILDDDGATNTGAVYILFMNSDGYVIDDYKISSSSGMSGVLSADDNFGNSITGIGDLDGDGNEDIIVGEKLDDTNGTDAGALWCIFLDIDGSVLSKQKITEGLGGLTADIEAGDGFGQSVCFMQDYNGDGIHEIGVGALGDDDGGITDAGAIYVLFMNTNGTVSTHKKFSNPLPENNITFRSGDNFGGSITSLGDVDGDGIHDLAVGAHKDDMGGPNGGAFYLLSLDSEGDLKAIRNYGSGKGGWKPQMFSTDDFIGISISSYGDFDSNGVPDLVLGLPYKDFGVTNSGGFYIVRLDTLMNDSLPGTCKSYEKITNNRGGFGTGLDAGDGIGLGATTIGDIDQDGISDMAIGARNDDDGGTDRGGVYICFMNADGTVRSKQKISDTQGDFSATLDNTDRFGAHVKGIGDLDYDGVPDIAVSAHLDDDGGSNRGALYIIFLESDGTVKDYQKISDTDGGFTGTLDDTDYFGWGIAWAGDIDGDDTTDIVVGAYGDDDGASLNGAVWVLFLNGNGTVSSYTKISDTQGGFTATFTGGDLFGAAVDGIGDLDGDNVPDIVVGASLRNGSSTDDGAFYVVFLNSDGTVKSYILVDDTDLGGTLDAIDRFGYSVAGIGDVDGDGVIDIAAGALYDDDGEYSLNTDPDNGAVYICMMNEDGTLKSHRKLSNKSGRFHGMIDDDDNFGSSVGAAGDLNRDGVPDIYIGQYQDDEAGTDVGAIWTVFLKGNSEFDNLYSELEPTPTAGSVLVFQSLLRFVYPEIYDPGLSAKLEYRIYNYSHHVVAGVEDGTELVPNSPVVDLEYGLNYYELNLDPFLLDPGFYLLEVTTPKDEKLYLKFEIL